MDRRRARTPKAVGLPPGLTTEELLDIYSTMVLVRSLDERVWALNRQGKAAIVASCQGHEAGQLGTLWAIRHHAPDYFFFPYYRDLALLVGLGMTPREMLLGFMAKAGEPLSGARQFPTHGASLQRHFINLSNVVGTQIPQAVGYALGCRMRREPTVVATYFGDGATSQGDAHEAMNFASVHKLPVLFLCENNKYATSVPLRRQMNVEDVALRAAGYGMPGVGVDGTDVVETYRATAEASERANRGEGPTLIELKVERYLPHTSDDDDTRYRPREEVQEARKRDPLPRLQRLLTGMGLLTEERDRQLREQAKAEVDQATDAAQAAPYPETADFWDHLYAPQGGR